MKKISFQGTYGAFSDLSCRKFYKNYDVVPCNTFDETLKSVEDGKTDFAMIPVENTIAGRVTDIHFLIQKTNLKIVAEHFLKIEHHLISLSGGEIKKIKNVYSHIHALSQCRENIKKFKLNPIVFSDTAAAAEYVSKESNCFDAAIASELSAKIYNLEIIKKNFEDEKDNITRFLVFSKEKNDFDLKKNIITTLIFKTNNIPTALYKALGGFATNGINLTRLESYFVDKNFSQSSFLIDIECHPKVKKFTSAMDELSYYSSEIKILGSYEASNFRSKRK